jgi:renalase
MDVLVIGAGMAGVRTATLRAAAGDRVTVVDKGRRHGGRMATRRVDGASFDTGALDLAAHDVDLRAALAGWVADGLAVTASGRWRGHPTARALPTALAERSGADVRLATTVTGLTVRDGRWHVTLQEGGRTEVGGAVAGADALVITAPAPQTLALLRTEDALAAASTVAALEAVEYSASLTVLVRPVDRTLTSDDLARPSAGELAANDLARLHDNAATGASSVAALTLQASAAWSAEQLDGDRDEAARTLAERASRLVGTPLEVVHVHGWRYAQVTRGIDLPALRDDTAGAPLVLAGDLFGPDGAASQHGRLEGVERAFLSGGAAARLLDGR